MSPTPYRPQIIARPARARRPRHRRVPPLRLRAQRRGRRRRRRGRRRARRSRRGRRGRGRQGRQVARFMRRSKGIKSVPLLMYSHAGEGAHRVRGTMSTIVSIPRRTQTRPKSSPRATPLHPRRPPLRRRRCHGPSCARTRCGQRSHSPNPSLRPCPDGIPHHVLQLLLPALLPRLTALYAVSLALGHLPCSWRDAICVVLKKPKKSDYTDPKAY